MSEDTLTQCRMIQREDDSISSFVTTWIPTKHSAVGTTMTLEGLEGRWEVWRQFDTLPEAYVKERSRDYRNTRKASDV